MGHSNVGADIFVRKIKPGPTVGDGYLVDVYEGGIKIDTFKAKNKKQIKSIVKDYKSKYNTQRSFMNESQVHVTYRTKAERGETAMTFLDEQLIKKANLIHTALKKIFNPYNPVIVREADIANNTVDFIPQTAGDNAPISEDMVAKNIIIKIVTFINERQPQPGAEWIKSDELYNPIKKWLFSVKKTIKDQEKANGLQLDFNKIYEISKNTLMGVNVADIKKVTGLDITPEVAAKIKEIMSMKVGVTKQAAANNGSGSGSMTSDRDSSDAGLDDFDTLKGAILRNPDISEGDIKTLKDVKHKTIEANKHVNDPSTKSDEDTTDDTHMSVNTTSSTAVSTGPNAANGNKGANDYSTIFWKHASELNREATLEDVFLKWASDSKLSLEIINETWKQINIDLGNFKEARITEILVPADFSKIFQNVTFITYIKNLIQQMKASNNKNVSGSPATMSQMLLRDLEKDPTNLNGACGAICDESIKRHEEGGADSTVIMQLLKGSIGSDIDIENITKNIISFMSRVNSEDNSNISYVAIININREGFKALVAKSWNLSVKDKMMIRKEPISPVINKEQVSQELSLDNVQEKVI